MSPYRRICTEDGPSSATPAPATSAPGTALAHAVVCARTGPHLRRDWPTSAPGLAPSAPGTAPPAFASGLNGRTPALIQGSPTARARARTPARWPGLTPLPCLHRDYTGLPPTVSPRRHRGVGPPPQPIVPHGVPLEHPCSTRRPRAVLRSTHAVPQWGTRSTHTGPLPSGCQALRQSHTSSRARRGCP